MKIAVKSVEPFLVDVEMRMPFGYRIASMTRLLHLV